MDEDDGKGGFRWTNSLAREEGEQLGDHTSISVQSCPLYPDSIDVKKTGNRCRRTRIGKLRIGLLGWSLRTWALPGLQPTVSARDCPELNRRT
jgi:hypothetical protein